MHLLSNECQFHAGINASFMSIDTGNTTLSAECTALGPTLAAVCHGTVNHSMCALSHTYRDARKSSTSFQTVQIRAQILTNQLLCVTVTATNKQHKFARAFEPVGNWWKTYAHPCIHLTSFHRVKTPPSRAHCALCRFTLTSNDNQL